MKLLKGVAQSTLFIFFALCCSVVEIFAQETCITKQGFPAAISEKLFDQASTYLYEKDFVALQKLIEQGGVILLKGGVSVYREDVTWSGKAVIRLPGTTVSFWTNIEAVDCDTKKSTRHEKLRQPAIPPKKKTSPGLETKRLSPESACSCLNAIGLGTRGWKSSYEDVCGCSSPYKEFGTGNPLKNNLAFYVEGKANTVEALKLMLNVNNKNEWKKAHAEMLKAASTLSKKALSIDLPQEIRQAIEEGKTQKNKIGDLVVQVTRTDWPKGNGYSLKFVIE